MAHKTLIGGTAYEVSGGKTLVGGTAYGIAGGRTLVEGTGYDISFNPSLDDLMADLNIAWCIGRDSAGSDNVYYGLNKGTYVLSFCNGYGSIIKINGDGVLPTVVKEVNSYTAHITTPTSHGKFYYSDRLGDSSTIYTDVYGATLAGISFPSYSDEQVENCLGAITTWKRRTGRDSSSSSTLSASISSNASAGSYVFCAYSSSLVLYRGAEIIAASTNYNDEKIYIENDSYTIYRCYGGTILEFRE